MSEVYYRPSADSKHHPRQGVMHAKLTRAQPVLCFKSNVPHPMMIEILGMAGVDCIWLDTEHLMTTTETMSELIRGARGVDVDTLVRVPNGDYHVAAKMLDHGANGIMCPQVNDVVDVERLVAATRFRPVDSRGTDYGPLVGGYTFFDFDEAMEKTAAKKKSGLAWGMQVMGAEHGKRILELGGRFLMYASDTLGVIRHVAQLRSGLAEVYTR